MNDSPATPLSRLEETDKLLHKFEIDNIPDQYRAYYGVKRNNFFASVQGFPEMCQYYLRLDAIWMREFADLESARDATRMFPLLLYFNAHAKMRVAMELAFSGCMGEARPILRDAIEFVAHAHTMISDPKLQKTWLSKNDGNVALEEFKNAFERRRCVCSKASTSCTRHGVNCLKLVRMPISTPWWTDSCNSRLMITSSFV